MALQLQLADAGSITTSTRSMLSRASTLLKNAASLGLAQGAARICSVVLIGYVARHLGVEALGELAIGLTIATYVRAGIDLGMPLIGARLVASNPTSAQSVVSLIQRKRWLTGILCVALGCLYALKGPIPEPARGVSLVFVFAVIPWIFSLEWLVWGLERFGILATSQISISIAHLVISILLLTMLGHRVIYVAGAYGVGMLLATAILQVYWSNTKPKVRASSFTSSTDNDPESGTTWTAIGVLGAALILNQLFQTVDVILMGALSTPEQLGLYSASAKIMLVMYGAFYVATNTAYPMLARLKRTPSINKVLFGLLSAVFVLGGTAAAGIGFFAKELLVLAYGAKLAAATGAFRVLLAALPLELLTASLSTILISDGRNGSITAAMAAGVLTSVVANVILIPAHGAMGAAWANLASYGVFFVSLSMLLWSGATFGDSRSRIEANQVPA
jgi:O-antigen/teichoic acid export membrane protein